MRKKSTFSSVLLFIGMTLYALSLMWPLGYMSPAWVAYPLAFIGIGFVLASLRNAWTMAKTRPRRA